MGDRHRKDDQVLRELDQALAALLESRQGREYISSVGREKLQEWLEQAESYGLDLMLEEEI